MCELEVLSWLYHGRNQKQCYYEPCCLICMLAKLLELLKLLGEK